MSKLNVRHPSNILAPQIMEKVLMEDSETAVSIEWGFEHVGQLMHGKPAYSCHYILHQKVLCENSVIKAMQVISTMNLHFLSTCRAHRQQVWGETDNLPDVKSGEDIAESSWFDHVMDKLIVVIDSPALSLWIPLYSPFYKALCWALLCKYMACKVVLQLHSWVALRLYSTLNSSLFLCYLLWVVCSW